jgi:hypothetical protein
MAKTCRRSGKTNYRSETAVLTAITVIKRNPGPKLRHTGVDLYHYKCPKCPYWHLTSKPQDQAY